MLKNANDIRKQINLYLDKLEYDTENIAIFLNFIGSVSVKRVKLRSFCKISKIN